MVTQAYGMRGREIKVGEELNFRRIIDRWLGEWNEKIRVKYCEIRWAKEEA